MSDVTQLPESLPLTEDDYRETRVRKNYKLGWYKWAVTKAEKSVSGTGSFVITLTCRALDADDNPVGPNMYHRITLPVVNAAKDGHTRPETYGFVQEYLRAVAPETFEAFPRYDKDLGVSIRANGDQLDRTQAEAVKIEIRKAGMTEINRRWQDPQLFNGDTFYAQVVANGAYRNLKTLKAELPATETVITEDMTETAK